MRYMPKPGQTAPQMPPRGPKVPINKGRPLNTTGTPVGRPKSINAGPMTPPPSTNVNPIRPRGGMGMTGGPKPIGAKKGGKVSSKMGAVKTSAKPDGIVKKGKTKGRMV